MSEPFLGTRATRISNGDCFIGTRTISSNSLNIELRLFRCQISAPIHGDRSNSDETVFAVSSSLAADAVTRNGRSSRREKVRIVQMRRKSARSALIFDVSESISSLGQSVLSSNRKRRQSLPHLFASRNSHSVIDLPSASGG